jgi:hypothetical protein
MQNLESLAQLAALVPAAVSLTFVPDPELACSPPSTEAAVLLRVWGAGDDLRAEFRSTDSEGASYDWEAYVFDGRLSYGTSAEELQVSDRVVPLVSA